MTITHMGMHNECKLNALIVFTASLPITTDAEQLMNTVCVKLNAPIML